jgi:hypothetical protein
MGRGAGIALTFLALVIGACGGGSSSSGDGDNSADDFSGRERDVAQVVEGFVAAVRAEDWDKICNDFYAPGYYENIPRTPGARVQPCPENAEISFGSHDELELTVHSVEITRDEAKAVATNPRGAVSRFYLKPTEDGWRIDGFDGVLGRR